MMTKRVNESLSSSNLSLRNEFSLQVDSLSSRLDLLQSQSQDTAQQHKATLLGQTKEILALNQSHEDLLTDMRQLQQQAQQTEQEVVELQEVMEEVTQFLSESKRTVQTLEETVQEMSHTNQPMIDSLYNRIRENNEKIQRFEDLLQEFHDRFRSTAAGGEAGEFQEPQEDEEEQHLAIRGGGRGTRSLGLREQPQQQRQQQRQEPQELYRGEEVDAVLLKHEERLQQITNILEEQHTDYQEAISKLSASNRKMKLRVKELQEKLYPLSEIKESIDQILGDILRGTEEDKQVMHSLKEENTQLITEVLSMKILCESMEEKYEDLLRRSYQRHQQESYQGQKQQERGLERGQRRGQEERGQEEGEREVMREQLGKLEEKIGILEGAVQQMKKTTDSPLGSGSVGREEREVAMKKTVSGTGTGAEAWRDRPMGLSEIHAGPAASTIGTGTGDSRVSSLQRDRGAHPPLPQQRQQQGQRQREGPGHGQGQDEGEDDAMSLLSETWHGTLLTHESKPHLPLQHSHPSPSYPPSPHPAAAPSPSVAFRLPTQQPLPPHTSMTLRFSLPLSLYPHCSVCSLFLCSLWSDLRMMILI
jgi:hypothetical protein